MVDDKNQPSAKKTPIKEKEELKKITEAETIVWLMFLFPIDVVCAVIDSTGVGMAFAPLLQGVGTISSSCWFKYSKKHAGALQFKNQLKKNGANLLPFLPTLTAFFLVEVYKHNHPDKFMTAGKIGVVAGKK
ncbi:hypothetical protein A3D55_03155 [Candidatus Jorgensenbacteria bacterium RIFCSPHIGHO2_02_FULL_45_20]|uniref:Uncharacterized protein n=2 Tax=Candidatus Joergenseniibacteriota TaxID=1752739 RepID=A0A1F6BNN3_9BACT|nr:MAG: hypothetical protein UX22_C0006G0008 [Candidatus Jorgensenbacteria bacterium GW2011_GWA2_45_9]OGG38525.1 MAG: hypothetical protein A3D55_03155 [Candidatus Jorgensenbacteria bacterium RIFCSPHIGHO2_02_FULL_45_20]